MIKTSCWVQRGGDCRGDSPCPLWIARGSLKKPFVTMVAHSLLPQSPLQPFPLRGKQWLGEVTTPRIL